MGLALNVLSAVGGAGAKKEFVLRCPLDCPVMCIPIWLLICCRAPTGRHGTGFSIDMEYRSVRRGDLARTPDTFVSHQHGAQCGLSAVEEHIGEEGPSPCDQGR